MKKLNGFITEVKGEKAHRDAVAMGLKYKGFGYWVDPNTGEVTHKTENDQLVPVDPDVESELADKDDESAGMARGGGTGAPGGMKLPGVASAAAIGMPDSDAILGTADPEQGAQRPKETDWEAGPDGDNSVDDQAPGDVPPDAYVGKTNYPKWQAGPDGSNYTNVTEETEDDGRVRPGAKTMMRQAMGQTDIKPGQNFSGTMKAARDAAASMRKNPDQQTALGNQVADMRKIANRHKLRTYDDTNAMNSGEKRAVEYGKQNDMWRKMVKFPAFKKDADAVTEMNKIAKDLVKDPDYDMTLPADADEDSHNYLDEGAFGQVFLDENDNVIKKGNLGPKELEALYAMRDNPAFPTLINAKFDGPFQHQSSSYNNPYGGKSDQRATGVQNYWDPSDMSDFDKRFPGAPGTYAMTKAKGEPLFHAFWDMDEDVKEKVKRNFWKARADLHKAGISHNDMHGGNIFVDPDTGEVNIIDLGLANTDPVSALMEALGGADFEEGDDYQLAGQLSGASLPERYQNKFLQNRKSVEDALMDSFSDDDGDEEAYDTAMYNIQELMRGGIRLGDTDLGHIRDDIPYLKDDNNVKKLIKMLYNEIGQSELADRMSDAFEKRQADSAVIRSADRIRALRGEKPLSVRNKNVVPPKNLDFDD